MSQRPSVCAPDRRHGRRNLREHLRAFDHTDQREPHGMNTNLSLNAWIIEQHSQHGGQQTHFSQTNLLFFEPMGRRGRNDNPHFFAVTRVQSQCLKSLQTLGPHTVQVTVFGGFEFGLSSRNSKPPFFRRIRTPPTRNLMIKVRLGRNRTPLCFPHQ